MYYLIYIFAFFAVVGFFNYHQMLSDQVVKAIFYAVSLVALVLAVTDGRSKIARTGYPAEAYWTLMGMICLSPVMAGIFHGQDLVSSVITTLPMFFAYSWFYILLKFEMPERKILLVMAVGCALAIPVYLINFRAFPGAAFGELPNGGSRGIPRIVVTFIELFPLLLFYAINKWSLSRKWWWILVMAVCVVMIVVSVIRQVIFVSALLAGIFLFRVMNWKQRLIFLLPIAVAIAIIAPRLSIFQAIDDLNELQADSNSESSEDIRIQAWRFYTYEYNPNIGTMILGNGIPALDKTRYGIEYSTATAASKCYEGDVGWAGFFFYFGLIATVALFMLMWKTLTHRKPPEREYLNYWILFIMITAVASGPILYTFQIFNVVTALYLAYAPAAESGLPRFAGAPRRNNTLAENPQPPFPA